MFIHGYCISDTYPQKDDGNNKFVIANPTSANPTLIIEEKFKVLTLENKEPLKNMRFINVLQPDSIFSHNKLNVQYLENDFSFGVSIAIDEKKEVNSFQKIKNYSMRI